MPHPIILDCDPGHDDAVALLLAFASPELELLGVTVTHGNVPLPRTLHNALVLLDFAPQKVAVYAGAARPLVRRALHAAHVHGESGLGDVALPPPAGGAEATRAAVFLAEAARARPGELSVVAIGPLTNVALALCLDEDFARNVRQIVLMGGSADYGNATPAAEFNFFADPQAARIVFESGVPVVMFGLNVTRQVGVDEARVAQLRGVGTRAGEVAAALLTDYLGRLEGRGRGQRGALHDPCAVAFLLHPELFGLRDLFVQINDAEGPDFGRSLCDVMDVSGRAPNARVGMQANEDGVYALLTERLARLA